jgi:hypothetical protein
MRKIALIGMLLLCYGISCQPNNREEIHRHQAVLYALAWSFPERMPTYVREHAGTIRSRAFRKETERFIRQLEQQALEMPSTRRTYQQALKISSEFGRPAMAEELHDNMMGEKLDPRKMARHFNDLNRSAREILSGDEHFYKNSEIYNYSTVTWKVMQYNTSIQHTRAYRQMLYELNIWYIQNILAAL